MTLPARIVKPSERFTVCGFLTESFAEKIQGQHWLNERFERNEFDKNWLYAVFDPANQLPLAAVYVFLDGVSSATVMGFRSINDEAEGILIRTVSRVLQAKGVKVWQVVASEDKVEPFRSLVKHGFLPPNRLIEMKRDLASESLLPLQEYDFDIQIYREQDFEEYAELLVETYTDTLDCPELNNIRTPHDTLLSIRQNVRGRDLFWYRVWKGGKPIGILLMNQGLPKQFWELSYLGLIPESRKQGIGRNLATSAIAIAALAGAPGMTLTCDERNIPGRKIYESLGFRSCGSYEVFLNTFKS